MPVGKLDGSGKRILVIDDDLAIRVLLQAVLRRLRFEVEVAEDGAAGLEKVQHGTPYDLILLDLMMPRLNGYEFIDRIASVSPSVRPHIVVFTAAGKRGVDKLSPQSVCASLLKPFDLDRFIEIVGECVNGDHQSAAPRASQPAV